ncbi:Hypothetical predicted protein [Paramuricea clavata]|uniref:DUF7041 domain-containing protein n=1 Tax=Paramuricea clavata TaxID=317549 RepID=A0A6S7LVL6_PARCT|nr:Hypothetical predicted protein [Paramuricea clavata]
MPPKKIDDRVLLDSFENIAERLDSLIKSARTNLAAPCPAETARILSSAILPLANDHKQAYIEWLSSSPACSEEKLFSVKKAHNETAMACDDILIALSIAAGPTTTPPQSETRKERLPKLEFRAFDKAKPKLWFDQLEIVLMSSSIDTSEQKFAALLRLMDDSTSSLLGAITRAKPPTAYEDAKNLLIKEFSLSKYDRVKAYLEASPGPDEKLSMFNARVESIVEDLSLDDFFKFCLLRHAPSAVRLQLSGSNFEKASLADLLKEADSLSQRANLDAQVVGAFQAKGKMDKKVCNFHRKFGKEAHTCTGKTRCVFWSEELRQVGNRPDQKGNDSGKPPRG